MNIEFKRKKTKKFVIAQIEESEGHNKNEKEDFVGCVIVGPNDKNCDAR